MSIKHNEPKFTDPATMACRGAVEHRATWMALLYDQAKKQGADAEKMCREAIRKCGHIHGDNMYKPQCEDPESAADFGKAFFSGQGARNMEIDVLEATHDPLYRPGRSWATRARNWSCSVTWPWMVTAALPTRWD